MGNGEWGMGKGSDGMMEKWNDGMGTEALNLDRDHDLDRKSG